jgi:glutamate dehydrogenase/leucine dehydrogenase
MVSGSGNVAQYAALKLLEYGAVVLTMSDSTGQLYEPNGFTQEQIEQVRNFGGSRWRTPLRARCMSIGVARPIRLQPSL